MIRLIGLDFDGTLIENGVGGPTISARTVDRLGALIDRGVCVGIVTGNPWWTIKAVLERLEIPWDRPLPQFVVSREAFIHWKRGGSGSMAGDTEWNRRRAEEMGKLIAWLADFHYDLYAELADAGFHVLRFPLLGDYGLEVYFAEEQEAEAARLWLRERVRDQPLARVHRNRTNTNIVLSTAGKGVSLLRAAASLSLAPDEVLAVGDGLNDLDMLDGALKMHAATTGNAAPQVQETVRRASGFVAQGCAPEGLEEILGHFTEKGFLPA